MNDRSILQPVIVGAGPVGLFLAIRLRQIGVRHILVIDPEKGNYCRSGDYRSYVFDEIQRLLSLPVAASDGRHIKDVEKSLYAHAQNLDITIEPLEFQNFHDGNILAANAKLNIEKVSIFADLVFDCTGTRRAVIKKVNEHQPSAFMIRQLKEPQSHILVRGKMNDADLNAFRKFSAIEDHSTFDITQDSYAEILRELSELGWNEIAPPYAYLNGFLKNKVNIYMRAPDKLTSVEQQQWIKNVIWLYTGRKDNSFVFAAESKKHPRKKVISHFPVAPHRTTPTYYLGDEKDIPIVIPIGDAMADMPPIMGRGLMDGIERCETFIKSLKINKTNGTIIEIDFPAYRIAVENELKNQETSIDREYNSKQKRITRYRGAHQTNFDMVYRQGTQYVESIADQKKGVALEKLNALATLDQSRARFETALFLAIHVEDTSKVFVQLLKIADIYKKLADHFNAINNYPFACKYYKMALDLFAKHFPDKHAEQVIVLRSNLMIVSHKRDDLEEVFKCAKIAREEIFPRLQESETRNKCFAKIIYNEILAHIKKAGRYLTVKPTAATQSAEEHVTAARSLMPLIIENPWCKGEDKILLKKLILLEQQIITHEPQVLADTLFNKDSSPNPSSCRLQ